MTHDHGPLGGTVDATPQGEHDHTPIRDLLLQAAMLGITLKPAIGGWMPKEPPGYWGGGPAGNDQRHMMGRLEDRREEVTAFMDGRP
jgi:hypothetical protein